MLAITVKWDVLPEYADQFMDLTKEFTQACRAEPGCAWFEWSRSVDDPNQYVLLEAYKDMEGGMAHADSAHTAKAMHELGRFLVRRPQYIKSSDDWQDQDAMEMPGQE